MNADEHSAQEFVPEARKLGAIDAKTERREIRSLVPLPRPACNGDYFETEIITMRTWDLRGASNIGGESR